MVKNFALYSVEQFEKMRIVGKMAAETLDFITPFVVAGAKTEDIDALLEQHIRQMGAIPATIGYRGYQKASCISVNHVVCHGIPGEKCLADGDIVNIDITLIYNGWFGDTSRMYYVGKPSIKSKRLVEVTYATMMAGIEQAVIGNTMGDIGHAMEKIALENGYSVVEDFCGHGIGTAFHQYPNVLNYGTPGEGEPIVEGMIFTVEPMVNIGKSQVTTLNDGWTVITKDRSLSAQFEHTIGITKNGPEIFTLSTKNWNYPPYEDYHG